jgi:mycothione reductase
MEKYDVVVLGAGCGQGIVEDAVSRKKKIAVAEPGWVGGTCLNVGCIPSKQLIAVADLIVETDRAHRLGVEMDVTSIDFPRIMRRMRTNRRDTRVHLQHALPDMDGVTFYKGPARFLGPKTLEVKGRQFEGDIIFITAGARPAIPPIEGLNKVDYLTNESLLRLKALPESLIIMGGGYIAVEYAHFFAAMGTHVTVLEMADRLVTAEEPEISQRLAEELGRRVRIHTGMRAVSVAQHKNGVVVNARSTKDDSEHSYRAERVLIAVGRRPNSDTLDLDKAGIKTTDRGFIETDDHMRTNVEGVYAAGDINGKQMFMHAANVEALVAAANAFKVTDVAMDYSAVPRAVFSSPQIAAVGLTEAEAKRQGFKVTTTVTPYSTVAKGEAMGEKAGFTKAVVEQKTERILGFHIIGPEAAILIQEVTNSMVSGGQVNELLRSMHIHPALSELIPDSFAVL